MVDDFSLLWFDLSSQFLRANSPLSMAWSASLPLLLRFSILVGLLSIAACARPCKTLFISYSFSSFNKPLLTHQNQNNLPDDSSSNEFLTFTEIRVFNPKIYEFSADGRGNLVRDDEAEIDGALPFASSSSFYGISQRTKDILSVVVALLFGAGCGALTAVAMFFAWSLFSSRYYDHGFDGDENDDDDDDDLSPKKMGYVKVPADAPAAPKQVV